MKILVFSDIHGAVPAVRELVKAEERNVFDAVVVAGDIGPKPIEMFDTLEPLKCPVLYVYGNWDYALEYDYEFGSNYYHLHGASKVIDGITFVGFSGCVDQWGKNPHWINAEKELKQVHCSIVQCYESAKTADEYRRKVLEQACEEEKNQLFICTKNRSTKSYAERLNRLENKYERLIEKECNAAELIEESGAYKTYVQESGIAWRETGVRNREEVIKRIYDSGAAASRVIIVSHERIYRLPEYMPNLGGHIYGHRHGFKVTKHKGTLCVNASSIDPASTLNSQYGIIEWAPSTGFSVIEKNLPYSKELFRECSAYRWG